MKRKRWGRRKSHQEYVPELPSASRQVKLSAQCHRTSSQSPGKKWVSEQDIQRKAERKLNIWFLPTFPYSHRSKLTPLEVTSLQFQITSSDFKEPLQNPEVQQVLSSHGTGPEVSLCPSVSCMRLPDRSPPPPSASGNPQVWCFFSMSLVFIYFFLDSTYEWVHRVFVFLSFSV